MFKFHSNISWGQLSIYIGAVLLGWTALQGTVPEPWHDKILAIFTAVSAAVAFILKGGTDKAEPPKTP